MTSQVMLYHAMKQDYNPLDNRLAVLIMACCVAIICTEKWINVEKSVLALIAITLVCQLHYIVNIICEMCDVLNIKAFKVKPKADEPSAQFLDSASKKSGEDDA